MNRRHFAKSGLCLATGLVAAPPVLRSEIDIIDAKRFIPALRTGDRVGVITPSSRLLPSAIETAIEQMESLGLSPVLSKYVTEHNGFLAGTDEQRVEDINTMFNDQSIKAIWCGRGGYGSTRILHMLDYKMIKRNPKPFIGYSDISAYHLAIYRNTGMVTFHGPIPSVVMKGNTRAHFKKLFLQHDQIDYRFDEMELVGPTDNYDRLEVLRPGVARGKLIGGNLTVVCSMVGFSDEPDFKNSIAFFEDIDEQPYRVDRMLTQLIHGSNLKKAKGILLGQFTDCTARDPSLSFTLVEVLKERLLPLGIPILAGAPFGHVPDNLTIPVGAMATLDVNKKRLRVEEILFR